MKVLKFGGTSVQDAKAIANVAQIIKSRSGDSLVVVTSACAGVTNSLLEIVRIAAAGGLLKAKAGLNLLRIRMKPVKIFNFKKHQTGWQDLNRKGFKYS